MYYLLLDIITFISFVLFTLISFDHIEKKINLKKMIYFFSFILLGVINFYQYYSYYNAQTNYLSEIISLLIIIIILIFLLLSIFSFQFLRVRVLFIPFFLVLLIFRIISQNTQVDVEVNAIQLNDNILIVHIISSLISYSFLTISTVTAFCIFIQTYYLKKINVKNRFVSALPSINESEIITIMLLNLTVLLLTISLISGYFYYKFESNNLDFILNNKIIISLVALFLIIGILAVRRFIGLAGQTIFKMIILSYFLINFSYFGIKFLY